MKIWLQYYEFVRGAGCGQHSLRHGGRHVWGRALARRLGGGEGTKALANLG
ncbi:MAG: hypothetical protein U5J83_05840 [Bryobacterales bacterium]|nr:hypothetical protein [Bryobacterales bacterium]